MAGAYRNLRDSFRVRARKSCRDHTTPINSVSLFLRYPTEMPRPFRTVHLIVQRSVALSSAGQSDAPCAGPRSRPPQLQSWLIHALVRLTSVWDSPWPVGTTRCSTVAPARLRCDARRLAFSAGTMGSKAPEMISTGLPVSRRPAGSGAAPSPAVGRRRRGLRATAAAAPQRYWPRSRADAIDAARL